MFNILKYTTLILCMGLLLPPGPALAGEAGAQDDADSGGASGLSVQVLLENDVFYDTDYHYTNGFQLSFTTPALNTFSIGQLMYTPERKLSPYLQKDDRPYAAYLYGALASHWLREARMITLELAVGAVGPVALGEEIQNGLHRLIDVNKSKGWDHQLENEPMLMLSLAGVWRLKLLSSPDSGWGVELLPRVSASAGTPYTRAGLGFELRLGWQLPNDFSSPRIRPGSGAYVPDGAGQCGVYIFGGAEAQAVAWNTLLDGNIWRDSHSVDKFPLVCDVTGGLMAMYKDFRLSYTHVYRSKEFHGRKSWQNFSSLMVAYVF